MLSVVEAHYACGSKTKVLRFDEALKPSVDGNIKFSMNPLMPVSPPNMSTGSLFTDLFNEQGNKEASYLMQARTDIEDNMLDIDLARRQFLPKDYKAFKDDIIHHTKIEDALKHGLKFGLTATDLDTGKSYSMDKELSPQDVQDMLEQAQGLKPKSTEHSYHITYQRKKSSEQE